jgi:hypothetical protein
MTRVELLIGESWTRAGISAAFTDLRGDVVDAETGAGYEGQIAGL